MNNIKKIFCKWIAFDLDGTLYTSEPVLYDIYASSVDEYNNIHNTSIPTPTREDVFRWVGYPVRHIFKMLFPLLEETERINLSNWILKKLISNIEAGAGELIPGVEFTLNKLQHLGFNMYVVTNGRPAYLQAVINSFNLKRFFKNIYSIKDGVEADKGDLLLRLIREENISFRDGVMVGDRLSDAEAARTAKIPFIGCNFGHGNTDELTSSVIILKSFPEILKIIEINLASSC